MINETTALSALLMLVVVDPQSAIGAIFGCCFYLAMPSTNTFRQTMLYTMSSAGIGYSAGISVWALQAPMLVSSIVSASVVALLISLHTVIKDRLMDLISLLINLRK